jgi:hypothetical protein
MFYVSICNNKEEERFVKDEDCSMKKYSKTNPGKLFKWGFFKKERSLSLSLCNLRSYVS